MPKNIYIGIRCRFRILHCENKDPVILNSLNVFSSTSFMTFSLTSLQLYPAISMSYHTYHDEIIDALDDISIYLRYIYTLHCN